MGILAVNLKHYYQRFELWVWYVVMLGFSSIILVLGAKTDLWLFCYYTIAALASGFAVGSIQKETMSKPFAFCLPGHRSVSRKVIFLIGSVISVLLSILLITHLSVTVGQVLLLIVAGSFVAMVLYLFGVILVLGRPRTMANINYLICFIFLVNYFGFVNPAGRVLLSIPAIVIALGLIICLVFWRRLGRGSWARENCGKLFIGMFDGVDVEKERRCKEEMLKVKMGKRGTGIFGGLEGFFLGKMQKQESYSLSRYVWGHVYAVLGRSFGEMRWRNVALWSLILLACGYLGIRVAVLSIVPIMVAYQASLNAYPTVLVPGGRRERFWGVVASGVTLTAAVAVIVSVFAGVSMWLETFMPTVTLKGHEFDYGAMSFYALPMGLIFMPLVLAVGVMFSKSEIAKPAVAFIFAVSIIGITNPIVIGVLIAGAWLFYFWMIGRYFRRGQLV